MSPPAFVHVLRSGWWLIVGGLVLGLTFAGLYASQQRPVYEATVTMYVHPSESAREAGTAAVSSDVSLLSYGSLVNTIESLAESRSVLASVASPLGVRRDQLGGYTVIATLRPKSFIMDVSIDGRDRRLVAPMVNSLSHEVASTVGTSYPIAALSVLDAASSGSQVRPRVRRDLVYGGLAGLIIGFVLAGLWSSAPFGNKGEDPPDDQERPAADVEAAHADDQERPGADVEAAQAEAQLPTAPA